MNFDYVSNGKPGYYPEWYKRNSDKMVYEKALLENGYTKLKEYYKKSEFEIFNCDVETGENEATGYLFLYEKELIIIKVLL